MNYPVKLPGFEGQQIVVVPASLFAGPKLLVGGQPAPKGRGRGEMLLRRNDGKDVVVTFKNNFLDVPILNVDGKPLHLVEPLQWYQWVWNALPVALIFHGSAFHAGIAVFAAALGVLALTFNVQLFRSAQSTAMKYVLTGLVSVAAFVIYFIASAFVG